MMDFYQQIQNATLIGSEAAAKVQSAAAGAKG
jgi:hypothetical protein